MTNDPVYSHTQKAPLCLILYGSALLCFALAWTVGSIPGNVVLVAVGLLIALLAPAFHHLTVEDQGDRLAICFGPLPLFRMYVHSSARKPARVSSKEESRGGLSVR